mgnify:CR=1 FL=1
MAALNEAVEVATERLGPASEAALGARAALSNTFTHFGHAREALQAIEPALAPARSAFGTLRPHGMLLNIERFHADALARYFGRNVNSKIDVHRAALARFFLSANH